MSVMTFMFAAFPVKFVSRFHRRTDHFDDCHRMAYFSEGVVLGRIVTTKISCLISLPSVHCDGASHSVDVVSSPFMFNKNERRMRTKSDLEICVGRSPLALRGVILFDHIVVVLPGLTQVRSWKNSCPSR